LLERFLADRDEAAFTALVRRHGAMVFGVCRRVLHHEQDAEDAFQATFLILARKAASLRLERSLGGWLHEVAYHLALRARENTARRQSHEKEIRSVTPTEDAAMEASRRELRSLLDEELRQLPAKYREPLILCYLEGKTNEQAARQLGWPAGSMSRRLARGRELLRRRLVHRGLTLSVGALTAALIEPSTSAAVPPGLVASVVRMAVQASAAGIPASVAVLVEERVRGMVLARLRVPLFLALTAMAVGAGALAYQTRGKQPAEEQPASAAKTAEKQAHADLYGDPLPPGALARLGTVRLRHLGMRIAFSTDGKRLLSFSERDKTVRHWDLISGRELRRIPLLGAEQMKSPLSAWAGKTIAMSNGEHLALWDASTGQECRRIKMVKNAIHALALSPSGETVAAIPTDKGETVRLWDVDSGKELRSLDHPQQVYELTFSPDGKLLGALTGNQDLHLWETSTGKRLGTILGAGRQIAISPDGSKVASVTISNGEGILKVWSVSEGREVAVMPKVQGAGYFSVCFSPDSKLVASGGTRDLLLFDISSRKLLRRIPSWGWIAFSPDGKILASAGVSAIHLWDTATGREISPRPCQDGPINFLAATSDGRCIASLSPYDAIVYLWDVASSKSLVALRAGGNFRELHTGALSADGKRFASGGSDGKVRVWDLDTAREVRQMNIDLRNAQGQLNPEIIALSFLSGTDRLAAVSMAWHTRSGFRPKYQLDLWDLNTGESLARRALPMESWPASFSVDGLTVVFRARDRLVVQDVATGREWASFSGELREPFAWSPDGQFLALTFYERNASPVGAPRPKDPEPEDPRTIVLTELVSGKTLFRIETGKSGLNHLAYSPDGRMLAGTVSDGFRVWDLATGKEVFRRPLQGGLRGYPFATSLSFLPDGGRLATGLQDGTILIWDLEPKTWHAGIAVQDLAPRDLERLWADLAAENSAAVKANQAVWTLAAVPARAVPFLKEHLRPAVAPDAQQVQRLIADLDSPEFTVRETAAKRLASFGEQAEPALRQALEGKPSLEARKRLEALHADAEQAGRGVVHSAELLRTLRAIRVLEHIGDREARQVLQKLAAGDPAARSTRQAREALRRLERRAARQ
jgi:RNA polymerase sigma factor (sigma-70 family)